MDFKEKIKLIVELQAKDINLDKLRSRADAIPLEIEEKNSFVENLKGELEAAKKHLTQFQLDKKNRELELESKEQQIKKHNTELNSIKSNDAYRALLSEIEGCKKVKSGLENDILELMDMMEKEAVAIKENDKAVKEKENGFKAEIKTLESELSSVKADIQKFESERAGFAKNIPDDILSRYEYIRESRDGIAVVPMDGNNCGGCHIVLRPALINEVRKGQDVVVCDSCSRIIYEK